MRSAPEQVYNGPPEVLVAFDLQVDGTVAQMNDACCAWGSDARVGRLAPYRVVLTVQAGGSRRLAK
jgi:hypothetical protein